MPEQSQRPRWIAIVTGAISVAIGLLYLLMITALDARGPLLPPPPEALVGVVVVASPIAEAALPPDALLSPKSVATTFHAD
jgi:hypothetical protein